MNEPVGLTPKQIQSIGEADSRLNIWEGAIRSGKTVSSLLRWVGHLVEMRKRGGEAIVVGATRDSIGRNVFAPLQDPDLLGEFADQVSYTLGASTATVLGMRVHVIGASDAKAETKIRGATAKSLYADEIVVLPKEFFKQGIGRLSVPGAKLFGTTNPGAPNHWLRQDLLLRKDEPDLQLSSWHFKIDDNTFLEEEYIANQKAAHLGLFYRRFILGEWVAAEGAVFDIFDEDRHVIDEVPEVARRLAVGCDYGTSNPFAALVLVQLGDGRLCFTRELRTEPNAEGRKFTDADHLRRMADWLADERVQMIAVDPSAASFKEEMRRSKVPALARARDADNTVLDSIRLMSSMLATGQLVIHRSCTGLINELPGYSWDDKASEKGEDKPVKVDDHSIDAARYALYTSRHLWQNGNGATMSRPRATRVPSATVGPLRR